MKEYEDVFSEKTSTKLPPSQLYNHVIKLKDSFVPQWTKAYPLNSIKHQACKEFVKEHLKIGRISPLKSLQAASFFFVKKKEAGKLYPCQEYQYLNSHTIKNTYSFPFIKPEDRWKTTFTIPLGLFELNIMFFGTCNSPATFQAFMDDLFGDYIAEGWLVIYMDDLLIHSSNQELHNKRTQKVLQQFWEQKIYLKLEKCMFSAEKWNTSAW